MDREYGEEELKVLGEFNPKTTEEYAEWRHRYTDALNDDLNKNECGGCGALAIIRCPDNDEDNDERRR